MRPVLQPCGTPLNTSLSCLLSPHLLDWSPLCVLLGVSECIYCWEDPSLAAGDTTTTAALFQEQSCSVTFLTHTHHPGLHNLLLIPLIDLLVSAFLRDFLVQMVLDNHLALNYWTGPARTSVCCKGHHLLHTCEWLWTNSDTPTGASILQPHPGYQTSTLMLSKGFDVFSWLDSINEGTGLSGFQTVVCLMKPKWLGPGALFQTIRYKRDISKCNARNLTEFRIGEKKKPQNTKTQH